MSMVQWAILLFAVGIVLLIAELILPTHGILGVAAIVAILGTIAVCFAIDPWLGVGALAVCVIAAPFVFALFVRILPRTPVGRAVVLGPTTSSVPQATVQIGDVGVTVSELRPMGVCEFADQRVEAMSEYGLIPPGRTVRVVALSNRRPTVRPV